MNISERIKELRKVKQLSQQEIADKIGIDRAQYSRVETGKTEPTITSLQKIAQALEVDIADFFKNDESYNINSYDKTMIEKIRLIEELDEPQKQSLYTIIDTAISQKRMKEALTNAINLAS